MTLVRGHGEQPGGPGCVMQFSIWRLTEGQVWADVHPCFNSIVTYSAQRVNDSLSDEGLVRLDRDFSPRIDRARAARSIEVEARVNRRLALWAARRVEHLAGPASVACNDVTERFLAGEATREELLAAREKARQEWYATTTTTAAAAAAATAATTTAADAAAADAADADATTADAAATAATTAADAAAATAATATADAARSASRDDALLDYLDALLEAHEKIAADEGALGDLWDWASYQQVNGS